MHRLYHGMTLTCGSIYLPEILFSTGHTGLAIRESAAGAVLTTVHGQSFYKNFYEEQYEKFHKMLIVLQKVSAERP